MREFCFSAGTRTGTATSMRTSSSRSIRSNASNSFFQRKRTLDEFPMEHSLQDTHRLLRERRANQAKQRENHLSNTGESKQLSSYSRKRFETALTNKNNDPLPPASPEERVLFWDDVKPSWSHRRFLSMSAKPAAKTVEISPRPGSGPPGGATVADGRGRDSPSGRPFFNHLRGNNSAYPTIRRLLLESNAEYRVVCPTAVPDCKYDRCRRPSLDCSSKSDYLLIPLEDEEESEEERREEVEVEDAPTAEDNEDLLQEEMLEMAKYDDAESPGVSPRPMIEDEDVSKPKLKNQKKEARKKNAADVNDETDVKEWMNTPRLESDNDITQALDSDDEGPDSPWHCWVDDATVSSITSKKSDPEGAAAEVSPAQSPAPEMVVEPTTPVVPESQLINVPSEKLGNRKSNTSVGKKGSNTGLGAKGGKGKRKGAKHSVPEPVEEIIELPPPPPPPVVEEVVEEVKEEEIPPEPVLPSYICPSSVIKSTQAEIKLWLNKSTFSAANRLLPIY